MATQKEAIFWGAIAGGATLLAEALALDPASLFKEFDGVAFLGYCVKAIILMGLGAIVVRINQETNIQKAFQLGIMAPALIVGIQSGAALNNANSQLLDVQKQMQKLQSAGSTAGSEASIEQSNSFDFFIKNTYAGDPTPMGEHREVSTLARFWYGLTGSATKGWFVVVGSHKNKGDAEKQAAELRQDGWDVKIGSKLTWGGYYSVLVGSYLSKTKATAIRDLAIREGLPKDTYVWRK